MRVALLFYIVKIIWFRQITCVQYTTIASTTIMVFDHLQTLSEKKNVEKQKKYSSEMNWNGVWTAIECAWSLISIIRLIRGFFYFSGGIFIHYVCQNVSLFPIYLIVYFDQNIIQSSSLPTPSQRGSTKSLLSEYQAFSVYLKLRVAWD